MRWLIFSLTICALLMTALPTAAQTSTPTPPTYQATPVADTFVRNRLAEQTINYGATNSILYRRYSFNNATAFVYWGLPESTAKNVTAATMFFNVTTNPQPVALWETWPVNESMLFANVPPAVNFLAIITPTLGWNSYDISGSIRDGKTIMFVAASADSNAITFTTIGSRQSSVAPYINYQLAPTASATATPSPTPLPAPTPIPPDYTIELPDNKSAELWLTMTAGDFAITVTLMLALVPLVLLVFQNWGREISDRY